MKKIKVAVAILVSVLVIILMVNGLINENMSKTQNEVQITTQTIVDNTNTAETTKVAKKVVKTRKKKTTKKTKTKKVATASYSEYQNYAKSYGNYDTTQMNCLINLWNRESGWNPNSINKSSGACGIPQALPCNKIKKSEGSNDWKAQIRWGIKYISYRYKTPCGAWEHFKNKNWY